MISARADKTEDTLFQVQELARAKQFVTHLEFMAKGPDIGDQQQQQ